MVSALFYCLFAAIVLVPLIPRLAGSPFVGGMAAAARHLVQAAFWLAAGTALLIAMAQMAALVTRNIFGINFIWLQESALYLFGAMFLLSSGAILIADGHVRVDVFYSQWTERRQRFVNLVGLYLFVFPVAALVINASLPYVLTSWQTLEGSPEPNGIQAVFLLKSLIPIFGFLLACGAFVRVNDLLSAASMSGTASHG
ncbi:TRAP transporter small permease subunit [Parvularcula sp. LCG005]|uniref:TRAP transporter small permease subunit n=1 Tax=Parvularcula sp. LCG005 TaxID=3078805 RepID=UPI00294388CD|nr:TRAP transporter small permease subunit [Parvularcula sp. LCG005]WOI54523.1 TRAP transporter small permease subunit [Parvularcula sp. LCG005]